MQHHPILFIDQTMGEVRQLPGPGGGASGIRHWLNAPAFSNIAGAQSVNIPVDNYGRFYQLPRLLGYLPQAMQLNRGANLMSARVFGVPFEGAAQPGRLHYIYSFVHNPRNDMIYAVTWLGSLLRFDPRVRDPQVLAWDVRPRNPETGVVFPNPRHGNSGTNVYLAFHPSINDCPTVTPEAWLYMSFEDFNVIGRLMCRTDLWAAD